MTPPCIWWSRPLLQCWELAEWNPESARRLGHCTKGPCGVRALSHPEGREWSPGTWWRGSLDPDTVCIRLRPLAVLFSPLPISVSVPSAGICYRFSFPLNICCQLHPVVFFCLSWLFSHLQGSVSSPQDNYVCYRLRQQACCSQGPPSAWRNPPGCGPQGGFFLVCFRRHGEFPSSERVKWKTKTSRSVRFSESQGAFLGAVHKGRCCEESEAGTGFLKPAKSWLLMFLELREREKCSCPTAVQSAASRSCGPQSTLKSTPNGLLPLCNQLFT